ncbi:YbgA family protein [Thiomicrorhabdus sp.]|uniref:YbgA family protein n=1 Tax=Thiomicrorhabdus sp. TaxID=2039724 RepID=UPI0029C650D1|nr:DUF1722 domain-containing protein [Thiomicrorhabdus sp.]
MSEFPRLNVALSDCLSGCECRYNGGHAQDEFVIHQLAAYADFFKFCPEAPVLGTPREPIRLVQGNDSIRVVGTKSGRDVTDGLLDYTEKKLAFLQKQSLDGAVVKSRSPSCGLERIKVYRPSGEWFGSQDPMDQGVFTKRLQEALPWIAIEEEGRLQDPWLRENFMLHVFTLARWRNFLQKQTGVADLQAFHRDHKYLLLSKNESLYRQMGPIVAEARKDTLQDSLQAYEGLLHRLLATKSNKGKMLNTLEHMYGYFKKQVGDAEKELFRSTLQEFKEGIVPLISVMKLLQQFIHRYGSEYLQGQVILDPYPPELALRSHLQAYKS